MTELSIMRPQEGRQWDFVASEADECFYLGKAGGGKALCVETPIPTPTGWKRMGDLVAGDTVLDESGKPCTVTAAFDVQSNRSCYEIVFSDREAIIADESHLWHTQTHLDRLTEWFRTPERREARREKRGSIAYKAKPLIPARVGTVKTTAQIRDSLKHLSYTNHSIAVCGPLSTPELALPVDPYVLGTWLGDGTSQNGSITTADLQTIDLLLACGETINRIPSSKYGYNIVGLAKRLRALGLKDNKHIPQEYLRASIEQRVSLLQGLMDTDGYAAPNKLEFTTTSPALRDGVYELLVSLGIKVSLAEGRATLYGKDCGPKWRICFVTHYPAFRLDRKLKNQKREGFRSTTKRRYIVAVNPVESRPVRCIAVDSPSRLFLAGRGMIPTHNSQALLMDFLYDIEKPLHNGILFRKRYQDLEDLIHKAHQIYPALGATWTAQKHLWTFPSGARLWMTYLERDTDVYSWLGWEFTWIGWDELPQFGKMPYLFMFSRLRCADPSIHKRVRATGNMDGPGIGWVINRTQKAVGPSGTLKEKDVAYFTIREGKDAPSTPGEGVSRQWFFSERSENKFLDPSYEKNLDLLPTEKLKKAYKDGIYVTHDEPDQLIKTEWVDAAIDGLVAFVDGNKAFGTDYAELGNDKSVEVFGRGNQPQTVNEWDYMSHPAMARNIANAFELHGLYQLRGGFDTVGTGAGVHTSLAEINPVMAARTNPIRYKDTQLQAKWELLAVKILFKNIQDQILWKLREDFEFGRIDLSALVAPGPNYYENITLLKEEICALYYKIEGGYVWISSSNDLRRLQRPDGRPSLGRSPDRLKALAIWNYARDWTPDRMYLEDKPQRGDYGYRKEKPVETVSAYI